MAGMTYADAGVDYAPADKFKIWCQKRAAQTARNAVRLGVSSIESTRGESVFGFELYPDPRVFLGHVEEGLGTKDLVADAMCSPMRRSFYDGIGQDTLAMIVNDMATLGVMPFSAAMHLAVESADWFSDEQRALDLVNGWGDACDLAGCVWSGGETPMLRGLVVPHTALLSGSALGIAPWGMLDSAWVRSGDAIIFLESSGIHANGLTLARVIGERRDGFWRKLAHLFFPGQFPLRALPKGYYTEFPGGNYGEALLQPTHIYVRAVEVLMEEAGIELHYGVNVTGHGWRKLMRAPQPLAYVIDTLPTQLPIFEFIQRHGPMDDREAYGNLNMGAGYALYLPYEQADKALAALERQKFPFRAFRAGYVEHAENKQVFIRPKNITFQGETLNIR